MPRKKLSTTPERSQLMSRVKQSGTSSELAVRKIVSSFGFIFDVNPKALPGSPDLANQNERWAIFVHGCFWHAHEGCTRWTIPKRNRAFWEEKFEKNRNRDKRKVSELIQDGYSVLIVWECEIKDEIKIMYKIQKFLSAKKHA